MTISTFTAGLEQSHWITRGAGSPGPAGQTVVEMGDNLKGGGSDGRRSTYHSWDIDGLPKHAIIDEAYIEFLPTTGTGIDIDDPNYTHVLALMYADGHWNRSAQNALHQAEGGAYYYAPSQTDTLWFTVRNSVDSEIADTMPVTTGFSLLANSPDFLQGLGTTVEIPAGEDIKTVRVFVNRLDAPLPGDPGLTLNLYTLSDNGRQFSLDALVASSVPVPYSSVTLHPAGGNVDFTFATAIPSQAAARWVGLMIEGEIFDPIYLGTQRYQLVRRAEAIQTVYLSGTAGSLINANADTDEANANSLVGYLNERSVPCLYPISSSTLITTPYSRFFGTVMSKTECGPWTAGVPKTYGSAAASEEFPNFVQNLQDWIDSAHYSPLEGKTWIGMLIDIASPDNTLWRSAGPAHATLAAYKLVLDWHPRLSAARSSSRALSRVSASASRARERVASSADARERVFAHFEVRPRVRPARERALSRTRAPGSNARSMARVSQTRRAQRVVASQSLAPDRVRATARARERVAATVSTAGPRVRPARGLARMRVSSPLSNARSGV